MIADIRGLAMGKFIIYLLVAISVFLPREIKASHIVGGEIYYEHLGNNSYLIVLKLYRDCYNGQAPFDNPAAVGVYNNGMLVQTINMTFPGSTNLPIIITSPCLVPPADVCVEEAIYQSTVTLPPISGGYDLVYQRCCRNNTILNLVNPGGTGSTYMAHIPDANQVADNSSPHFNNFPPLYLCTNTPLVFDHAATDPDGDSLVYEFCDPYEGASTADPMPNPPSAPPFNNVNFSGSFSASNAISANPAFSIDPVTGLLTGTPTQIGQFVVGVCCYEYRDGVLLSVNKRDFQFNVGNCDNAIASIPSQTVFCDGYNVSFINSSSNATNYYWDFGDPNSTTDNSTVQSPSYAYSDSGVYQIMLIAYNNNSNCSDTAYSTFYVYPLLQPEFVPPPMQCHGDLLDFSASGSYTSDATFLWEFDPSMPNNTSENPTNISFPGGGTYNISLSVSQYGCTETVVHPLVLLDRPVVDIPAQTDFCTGKTITFQNNTTSANGYTWDFGDISSTVDISTDQFPSYTYPDTGYYNVTLIATNGLCTDTGYQTFHILPLLDPMVFPIPDQCLQGNSFSFLGGGIYDPSASFYWDFGSDASPSNASIINPSGISFNSSGAHSIELTVSEFGCSKTVRSIANVLQEPVAVINPQTEFCIGHTVSFSESSTNANGWSWLFGDPLSSNDTSHLQSPQYTYVDTGEFQVMLIAYNQFCPDTTYSTVQVNKLFDPVIGVNDHEQCIDDQSFNFYVGGSYTSQATVSWTFASGVPATSSNTVVNGVIFPNAETYGVTLQMQEYGCSKTLQDSVKLFPKPYPLFDFTGSEGCPPLSVQYTSNSFSATPASYEWNFGDGSFSTEENPLHVYETPGVYDVQLTIETVTGCKVRLSLQKDDIVKVYPEPTAGFSVTPDDPLVYSPVLFEDNSTNSTWCSISINDSLYDCSMYHAFTDTGFTQVIQWVKNEYGCLDTAEKFVYVKPDYAFYLPNAFTPEGDGNNEIFKPYGFGIKELDLKIFDRWGQLIFTSTDMEKGWNGKVKEKPAQQDVYVYQVVLTSVLGKIYKYHGTVTLLR